MLRVLIGFLFGTAVGAAAALLLAPSSGEELRNHMHEVADADRQRMRAEYQRGMDELHARVDKMHKSAHNDDPEVEVFEEDVEVTVEAEEDIA